MADMISGNNLEMLEEYSKEKKIIEDNPLTSNFFFEIKLL